jgi:hypothetical protein
MMKDGSMEIEMSQAVASIKGTILTLEETGSQSTLRVLEGVVDFRSMQSGESVSVAKGETVAATASGLSEKTSFDPETEEAKWQAGSGAIPQDNPEPLARSPIRLPQGALVVALCAGAGLLVTGLGGLGIVLVARSRGTKAGWLAWLAGGAALLGACGVIGVAVVELVPAAGQLFEGSGLVLPAVSFPTTEPDEADLPFPTQEELVELEPRTTDIVLETPTSLPATSTAEPTSPPPTATPEPSATLPPSETPPPPISGPRVFQDDFSDLGTGWLQLDDSEKMLGYSEGAMYGIALKQTGTDSVILIPHGFELPLTGISLYFRARPVEGKGFFGAVCNYIDDDNYYFIGITEENYTIARFEGGQPSSYFEPFWVEDVGVASENNEFQVLVSCDSKIRVMVNGYNLPEVDITGAGGGDAGIFAQSSQNAVLDGEFYYKILFDDVELTVP